MTGKTPISKSQIPNNAQILMLQIPNRISAMCPLPVKRVMITAVACGFLFSFFPLTAEEPEAVVVDHGLYADLLAKYVHQGKVDYRGFRIEEGELDRYLEVLEKADTGSLSRNQQFAFFINAYNAWTIKLILSRYPALESIKDLGNILRSPWEKQICRIDGKVMTLDDIEHGILRPRFKDPRVHFAINCAALSCPPLIPEPYRGSTLDRQLDSSARAFVNNPERNFLEGRTLFVSKIFKWFAEDFDNDVIGFFRRYAEEELKEALESRGDRIEVKYLRYDWSLNDN